MCFIVLKVPFNQDITLNSCKSFEEPDSDHEGQMKNFPCATFSTGNHSPEIASQLFDLKKKKSNK